MNQRRRAALAAAPLLCALLLAGCATPPPAQAPAGLQRAEWLSGRLALRVAALDEAINNEPPQQFSASFELQGDGERGELRLMSPMGTMLAVARWGPGEVMLQTPEGQQRFDSLEALARAALGEALPLAALPDWLAGRPWPGAAHSPLPEGFEQAGWRIDTRALGEGRVEARRPAAPEVLLRVRLDTQG